MTTPQDKVEISTEEQTYTLTKENIIEGFNRTDQTVDSHSRYVRHNGEEKGLKDVFRNIPKIPNDASNHSDTIQRRFEALGIDVVTQDGNNSDASTDLPSGCDIYIQRGSDGPYRENLGTSLTTPLTEDLRAELQDLISDSGVSDPVIDQLYELLNNENVTAWGARSDHDVVRSMEEGDQVLYVERGSDRSDPFLRYQQQIDLPVPEPKTNEGRHALQKDLAKRIWRDDGFSSLWFSTKDLSYYENPTDKSGYRAFNEVIRKIDPGFRYYESDSDGDPWWFTTNVSGSSLVQIDRKYLSHYDGASGLINALCGTSYVREVDKPAVTYLIIDKDALRERDFKPVVHEYDGYDADPADSSPDPRVKYIAAFSDSSGGAAELLIDADVNGYALIRDGNQIVGKAKLGCAFGKTVNNAFEVGRSGRSLKIASLVDYRMFQQSVSISNIDYRIGVSNSASLGTVTQIDLETYKHIHTAAITQNIPEKINNLAEKTTQQAELLWVAAAHLVAGKNVIFYGPPGTGKTYTAQRLTKKGFGIGLDITTAHAELTNYDLVGGYAPSSTENGNSSSQINWTASPGVLTDAVETCVKKLCSKGNQSWLLVDELNRANLDQAFGDVFTLLDQDYRDTQFLEYADRSQRMPYSFRLVATMNTSDQAKLFSLGYAFRRRFGFVPTPSLFADEIDTKSYDPIETPEQSVPARQDLRQMVRDAVTTSLTTSRVLLDKHDPIVYRRDAIPIDPAFAQQERIEEAYNAITDPDTFNYNDVDGIDLALELGRYINSKIGVDIGHTLMIDIIQFLVAADLITDGELDRSWLDWAITTQLLPQLDDFLGDVRDEKTIGSVAEGSENNDTASSQKRFEKLLTRLADCGLPRSKATLETAADGYQLI